MIQHTKMSDMCLKSYCVWILCVYVETTQPSVKLCFQSAWQRPAINTLSSFSWHWFYSQEEEEHGDEGETGALTERGGSGGEREYGCDASAPPYSGNVLFDASWILNPVKHEQAEKQKWWESVYPMNNWSHRDIAQSEFKFLTFWILPRVINLCKYTYFRMSLK